MKRVVCVVLFAALTFALLCGCDNFGAFMTLPSPGGEAATPGVTPAPTPDATATASPSAGATPQPTASSVPSSGAGDDMAVTITVGGEKKDITLKRQESSMGYVLYVWEDRFAYTTRDNKDMYTLDWQGMKLPEVSISVEKLPDVAPSSLVDVTAALLGEGGGRAELVGEVSKPAYLLAGTLLRDVRYGDYETTTDAYLVDSGDGGAFRVIVRYFPEAMEDVGQAVAYMMDSFTVK